MDGGYKKQEWDNHKMSNPDVTWETVETLDIGVDF